MIDQFFGKVFKYSLISLFVFFGLSAVSYYFNLGWLFLPLIGIATLALTIKKLEFGLAIAFIELLSSAHGHLMFYDFDQFALSVRMVVFAGVMLGWGIRFLNKRSTLDFKDIRFYLFLLVGIAAVIGFVNGYLNQGAVVAFKDGNAYLYVLYLLPVLSVKWNSLEKRAVVQMLTAGAVFAAVVSIFVLYLYSHFTEPSLRALYLFLRDTRLVEITPVGFGIYRAFLQTQIFVILFALSALPFLFLKLDNKAAKVLTIALGLSVAVVFQSMSRSFWFGLVFAIIAAATLLIIKKTKLKQWLQSLKLSFLSIIVAVFVLGAVVFFPFPDHLATTNFSGLRDSRFGADDAGISSRWNLLGPMLEEIKMNPILGSGFGKTVTFQTDDPRARAINPDGTWTTYSMEWGWLEVWLKMGVLGPISFLLIFAYILKQSFRMIVNEKKWIGFWLFVSAIFLMMTNVFSPYLNHPIGIGILLMLVIFLPNKKLVVPAMKLVQTKKQRPKPSLATAHRSKR
jgi:hypothetical protein